MATENELLFNKIWTANIEKCVFSTKWTPESETRQYEKLDNGYKLTVSGIHFGKPYEWGYTAFYDGKPHPVYGREDVDNIVAYRVTDLIKIGYFSKGACPCGTYSRFVSQDGTLTVQANGLNEKGETYFDVIHYNQN